MPNPHEYDEEYTIDPDLFESDRMVGRRAVYIEEAGIKASKASRETLRPCPQCGVRIIAGELGTGEVIAVEPDVPMYTLLWVPRAERPRLQVSRGYPAHQCRGGKE